MSIRPWRSTILVFAKAPVPGMAKTRLIPQLGKEKAAEIHAAMVTHSVALAAQLSNHHVQLWCAPNATHPLFLQLQKEYSVSLYIQQGKDLGQRMHYAFEQALKEFDAAIIIGTDCPTLSVTLLDQAFQVLRNNIDAIVAPADDGGYVLLGLKKADAGIFSDINWGTGEVYQQTIKRFQQLQLSWEPLATQWDVDRPEDVQRLANEISQFNWHPDLRQIIEKLQLNTAK
jgi:rSAM/selenodomain-associated transferase 1